MHIQLNNCLILLLVKLDVMVCIYCINVYMRRRKQEANNVFLLGEQTRSHLFYQIVPLTEIIRRNTQNVVRST